MAGPCYINDAGARLEVDVQASLVFISSAHPGRGAYV